MSALPPSDAFEAARWPEVCALPSIAAVHANSWADAARPAILAYVALEQASAPTWGHADPSSRVARQAIGIARRAIMDEIKTARTAAVLDAKPPMPDADADETTWCAYADECEAVARAVETVDAAIRRVRLAAFEQEGAEQ